MSQPAQRRRVAVVGGGIAGLTFAALLDQARFDVTVYEAQPERTTGAALGLWPAARAALAEAGVDFPASTHAPVGGLYRLDGARIATVRGPDIAMLRRPALMAALWRAQPASVRTVDELIDDPARLDAHVVVGADGVRSRVRGVVDPRAAARIETPYVTLRGMIPQGSLADELRPLAGEYWGAGVMFGLAPVGAGLYWFTGHRSSLGPEPLSPVEVLAEARQLLRGAAPQVRAVLDEGACTISTPPDDLIATRLWVTPPMRRYARGRYAVIGDAAHAALPNLGRGASDAILDAASLARTLNRDGSLARWQARRLPYTQTARAVAGLGMRVALSPRRDALWQRFVNVTQSDQHTGRAKARDGGRDD